MINLNIYDSIDVKIDKNKTWLDVNSKKLLSREIKTKHYYCICKKYNTQLECYEYFIIMLDKSPSDRKAYITFKDNYGRVKIKLNSIWNESCLYNYKSDININITCIAEDEDSIVYKLDI